jgi:hypothetical protein
LKSRVAKRGGIPMTTDIIENKRYAHCKWAEMKQDFLLVSSFGLWAAVLGFSPILALRFLAGS